MTYCSMALQSSQPLLRILHFHYPQISVLPEREEILVMLYDSVFAAFLMFVLIIKDPGSSALLVHP